MLVEAFRSASVSFGSSADSTPRSRSVCSSLSVAIAEYLLLVGDPITRPSRDAHALRVCLPTARVPGGDVTVRETPSPVRALAVRHCGERRCSLWLRVGHRHQPPGDPGAGVSISLEAYNESELNGATALLTPLGSERTRIEVDGIVEASGFGGGPHRAELIRGDCDDPGQRAADLGAVQNERARAEVDFGLPELTESEFNVAVWFLAKTERTLIACGTIPDSVETSD